MPPYFPPTMLDLIPSLEEPGFRLVDTGQLFQLLTMMLSVTPNVTAAGTNQATAKPINSAVNTVLNATGTNYGLLLPEGIVGRQIMIINATSIALNIFPQGLDYILPAGSSSPATSVPQAANTSALYVCVTRNPFATPAPISYWKQAGAPS